MVPTSTQRRTLDRLIAPPPGPPVDPRVVLELRDRLEAAVLAAGLRTPLLVTKSRLTDLGRCEGRFEAARRREGAPFRHGPRTARGLLVHKAVELDVGGRVDRDAGDLVDAAAERLADEDGAFRAFWTTIDLLSRDELSMRAACALTLFRETFPPLRRMRAELAPLAEWHVRADVAGGALVLDGRIDLALGRPAPEGPGRILIDLKADGARPEHVEDLRFYALLHGLRLGVAPRRVASVFLASGEWQAEDVTAEVLRHAAERVLGAVAATAALDSGEAPMLTPGRHCAWCPRARTCRASEAADDGC